MVDVTANHTADFSQFGDGGGPLPPVPELPTRPGAATNQRCR